MSYYRSYRRSRYPVTFYGTVTYKDGTQRSFTVSAETNDEAYVRVESTASKFGAVDVIKLSR